MILAGSQKEGLKNLNRLSFNRKYFWLEWREPRKAPTLEALTSPVNLFKACQSCIDVDTIFSILFQGEVTSKKF